MHKVLMFAGIFISATAFAATGTPTEDQTARSQITAESSSRPTTPLTRRGLRPMPEGVDDHANRCDDADAHVQVDSVCRTLPSGEEDCTADPYRRSCAYYTALIYDDDYPQGHLVTNCNTCLSPLQPKPTQPPAQDADPQSPIVLNLGNGNYALSGVDDPVRFDIDANGSLDEIAWTAAGAPMAFLAMDRNHNGTIDDGGELFGNSTLLADGTRAASGFDALAELDTNGDGKIDVQDAQWSSLLLWTDLNHDGISEAGEVQLVVNTGVDMLDLHVHTTHRRDSNGNLFRYESTMRFNGRSRPYYDIFFVIGR